MQAEKEHITYKKLEKVGARTPCVPPAPISIILALKKQLILRSLQNAGHIDKIKQSNVHEKELISRRGYGLRYQ